jgi:hypothetical protein
MAHAGSISFTGRRIDRLRAARKPEVSKNEGLEAHILPLMTALSDTARSPSSSAMCRRRPFIATLGLWFLQRDRTSRFCRRGLSG